MLLDVYELLDVIGHGSIALLVHLSILLKLLTDELVFHGLALGFGLHFWLGLHDLLISEIEYWIASYVVALVGVFEV